MKKNERKKMGKKEDKKKRRANSLVWRVHPMSDIIIVSWFLF